MNSNKALIERFYGAFQKLDAETMASCYHEDARFNDPVFNTLNRKDVADMWRMLIHRGGATLKIKYADIYADEKTGSAKWEASYLFSKTNRPVTNKIIASFTFQDGKIIQHQDQFSFWKWSKMALGVPGYLLGWSSFLKNKVSNESLKALKKFQMAQ